MMREALAGAVLAIWPDADVMECGDFPSAWAAAAEQPALILSDLAMPGAAPVAGVAGLMMAAPGVPILVVTGNEDDATLLALFDLGVAGFAPKTSRAALIDAAVRVVLAGGRYLPPRLLDLAGQRHGKPAAAGAAGARLTLRQVDVLRAVAAGQSNKEIARDLDLSPATIKAHIAAAMAAIGAANRTEAVFKAREQGLI
jgi:two-component system, NarL family, nitrate/nitrite response regulator NarL